jgi:hypothetical protein
VEKGPLFTPAEYREVNRLERYWHAIAVEPAVHSVQLFSPRVDRLPVSCDEVGAHNLSKELIYTAPSCPSLIQLHPSCLGQASR